MAKAWLVGALASDIITGKPKDSNRHLSECKELAPGDQIPALLILC